MSLSPDTSSSLYDAMTLSERIAALRALPDRPATRDRKSDLGRRRLKRWAAQEPFDAGRVFAERLALDSTNEEELEFLLEEASESIKDRLQPPPPWLIQLTDAFAAQRRAPLQGRRANQTVAGFLRVIEPLIDQGLDRLKEGVRAIARTNRDLPFDPSGVEGLFTPQLFTDLVMMLSRTMILELNVARLQGLLRGETAEERFQSFLDRLGKAEIAFALLQEYPALARQIVTRINNWVAFTLEFLGRLTADWDMIKRIFSPDCEPGLLAEIRGGAGDLHRGGRSVQIARFESGSRIVYKPRSLAIDAHFQDLLSWINERGDHPPFRTLRLLDRQSYGWMEFVERRECETAEQVERFYERQGGYLALLYALEAVDFHYENLIASGEHPVPVDLESLFHPRPTADPPTQSIQIALGLLECSVLRTSLLPRPIWVGEENDGIDFSGLGAVGGQLSPYSALYLEKPGTDEMHVARKQSKMPEGQNRPTIGGSEVNLLDYSEAIMTGFARVYRTLVKHKPGLLSESGPLARFANDAVRVILRPTRTYAELLRESFHPDLLRNALDRDRFFDRLWVETERRPDLVRVIRAERDDLHLGDIPIFTTRPRSRDVWTSSDEIIEGFFEDTGLDMVRRRVEGLNEEDLTRQLWFIRASFTTLSTGTEQARPAPSRVEEATDVVDREQLLRAAISVGDRLESLAIRGKEDVAWIGLSLINERRWSLIPLGLDLYGGLSGVAFFLSYLGAVTGQERYTALAQSALTTVQCELVKNRPFYKSIGGFSGLGGIIYTLTHLGSLFNRRSLLGDAEELIETLPPLIEQDELLDIIGGAAGCIGSLLSFHACTSSARALDVARQCGDRLIARAVQLENGIGWHTAASKRAPLTGFSHGAAGMAWALLQLATASGEERFREAARGAIAYERSLFSAEAGNWPDLRDPEMGGSSATEGPTGYSTAWCHGAPGIGLSRLCLLGRSDDARAVSELRAALKTTLAQGFGMNHSLCHGDLGNLELLLLAAAVLNDAALQDAVRPIAANIFQSITRNGWLCGVPMRVETPGFMVGLAGIGYGLLRIVDPERIPSALLLAPPLVPQQ